MREAVAQRDIVADGVHAGYAEAMIRSGVWKGGLQRSWRPPKVATPEESEAVFDRIAARFPRAVH